MKKTAILLFTLLLFAGCASMFGENISYIKTDKPYTIEATRNYLPKDVAMQPAYTIYEGSKWACSNKTEAGDFICCLDSFGTMSQWKYCLLVDESLNGFGFFELGLSKGRRWSEGKQQLFKK